MLTPDPAFLGLLTSQGQQPPVVVDTSWLLVGHADETTHVVKARNAQRRRGSRKACPSTRTHVCRARPARAGDRRKDIFQQVTERALRGDDVRWVEDLGWAHLGGGEVHCTTNAWHEIG